MDHLHHLAADTGRFVDVLGDVDPGAVVPTCPDWTAVDLAWHLADVQWAWGQVVAERLQVRPRFGSSEACFVYMEGLFFAAEAILGAAAAYGTIATGTAIGLGVPASILLGTFVISLVAIHIASTQGRCDGLP